MYLNPIKNIAKVSFALAMTIAAMAPTTEAQAQDLIARQAPIDRKMKTVDSLVINKAVKKQQKAQKLDQVNFEHTDLYTTWETKSVHCYAGQTPPDHYRIDLRGFVMPTPSRVVTSNFGYRPSFGRMHKGLDIKVYIGDTIVSAFDGKVRIVNYEAKGYGNYVVVRHSNGLETIYGHLSKHLCKVGDLVRAGQPIGLGGNTGRSTGSHLHFETRILGEAINPALMFDFVHQDVTGDFYEYRRNGSSAASGKGSTASTTKTKSSPSKPNSPAPAKPAATAAPVKTTAAPKQGAATAASTQAKTKMSAATAQQTAKTQPKVQKQASANEKKKVSATPAQVGPSKAEASKGGKTATSVAPATKTTGKVQTKATTEAAPAAKTQGKGAEKDATAKSQKTAQPASKAQGKATAQAVPATSQKAAQPAAKSQSKSAAQPTSAKSKKSVQSATKPQGKATATASSKAKTNGQGKKA